MSITQKITCLALWALLLMAPSQLGAKPDSLLEGVQELTLNNGMRFLLLSRKGAPVFSAYIRVKVGGIDEADGQTGIAHLLEHMAFKGTPQIGTKDYGKEQVLLEKIEEVHGQTLRAKGKEKKVLKKQFVNLLHEAGQLVIKEEFSKIYLRNGATNLNATTSQDLTSYFVTLPNTKLKLWAYLESSRLKNPVFREFYSERDVVGEERRTRVDDSPFGTLYEEFIKLAFAKSPYRRPTIGYKVDIQRLSASDLRKFYEKYYVPANMVGAIVGNIDLQETEKILRQYFEGLSPAPSPQKISLNEPQPTQAKNIRIKFDAAPSLIFGYLKPNMPHPDDYTFDVIDQILCQGRTSRLYKRLVEKDKLVQNVSCSPSTPGSRLENIFFVFASIREGHNSKEILQAFDEEIKRLSSQEIPPAELEKAKKNLKSQWFFDLESNSAIARSLSYFEAISGDWRYILSHSNKIQAVSAQDVQRVVRKYLKPSRRRAAVLVSGP